MAIINGREYDWSSIELRIDGASPIVGFTAVKYPWKVERELVRGASRKALGMTRGKLVTEEGSITMLKSQFDEVSSVVGWCDVEHTLVIQYTDATLGTVTDTVSGVRFGGGGDGGGEEGVEALTREVPFMFLDVIINGVSPIES